MDPTYARAYRALYERHWWWRARERLILDRLEALRPEGGWRHVLDVGCGDGLFFDRLERYGAPEGVEPDGTLVDPDGRWAPRITVAPFDERFMRDHRFGLILFLDVLEHMERPEDALRHARTLLEPDGVVVITVPASMRLWSGHDVINRHYRRYDRAGLVRLVEGAGLRIESVRPVFHWAYAAKLAAVAIERAFRLPARPPRVPPASLNAALRGLTRLEQALTRRVYPPFGSSLLLIARTR